MTIENWLDQATLGLAADSAARVREEIGEHYGAAIEAGATPQAAVEALGDPGTANRRYCRVLLTQQEAKIIDVLSGKVHPNHGRYLAYTLLLIAALGMLAVGRVDSVPAPSLVALVLTALLFRFLGPLLPITTPARGRWFRAVRTVSVFSVWWFATGALWVLPVFLLLPLYWEWQSTKIRRKIPPEQWPKKLLYL